MERCFARWAVSVVAWLAISATNAEWSRSAQAKVSPAEAERLKSALTPLGAERAGNASGTIPAWNGGYTQIPPGWHGGEPRPALFSQEKPLLTITSGNVRDYVDRLPAGAVALLKKFPDYRMEIYPTHRTAAAPASVYESVFRNATHAEAAPEGIRYGVVGAAGGIPFPIPSNGFEVVWNHLLAFWGPAREGHFSTYVASGRGTIDLVSAYRETADFPYYYPQATPQSYGGYYFKTRRIDDQPPAKAGEGYLAWQPIDTARYNYVAWRYLPGEHRVRRGPPLAYDAPDSDAAGFESLDEYYVFFGGPDRYDFRLLGKREMYIPYNNNLFYLGQSGKYSGHSMPTRTICVTSCTASGPWKVRSRQDNTTWHRGAAFISTKTPGSRSIATPTMKTAGCGSSARALCTRCQTFPPSFSVVNSSTTCCSAAMLTASRSTTTRLIVSPNRTRPGFTHPIHWPAVLHDERFLEITSPGLSRHGWLFASFLLPASHPSSQRQSHRLAKCRRAANLA
jgi:Protein of unknown function (DUF1329)